MAEVVKDLTVKFDDDRQQVDFPSTCMITDFVLGSNNEYCPNVTAEWDDIGNDGDVIYARDICKFQIGSTACSNARSKARTAITRAIFREGMAYKYFKAIHDLDNMARKIPLP